MFKFSLSLLSRAFNSRLLSYGCLGIPILIFLFSTKSSLKFLALNCVTLIFVSFFSSQFSFSKTEIMNFQFSYPKSTFVFKPWHTITETLQPQLIFVRRSILLHRRSCLTTMTDNLFDAISSLSLEDDEPLVLPDSPRFRVFDENAASILGRLLNPDCQIMAKMIEAMPRVWRMVGRVRGIALSKEKFQFIFKREEDLQTVLNDRPWSYDHWTMIMERWIPSPPEDFLTSFEVWVRIRNIPMNHYTIETMNMLAKAIGKVEEIAYDPKVSQKTDFVRARVSLKIVDPARSSKNLTIPGGETVTIQYEYEKLRKRCFHCSRLTHEKSACPLLRKDRYHPNHSKDLPSGSKDMNTGRPQLAETAKQNVGMAPPGFAPIFPTLSREDNLMAQQYIAHSDPTERNARIVRVQQSIEERSEDSSSRALRITTNLDKGKGHVFSYNEITSNKVLQKLSERPSHKAVSAHVNANLFEVEVSTDQNLSFKATGKSPTGFNIGASSEEVQSGNSSL